MSHERIIEVFDEWALRGSAEGMEEGHGDVVRQVLPKMDIRPGMQSLDVGCGNGWATRLLGSAAPGSTAIGIDASEAMVKRAEERHDLTTRAKYQVSTFEDIALRDGRFDRIFSMEALYYAVDLERAIAELFRLTKPGGQAHVLVDRFKESPHTESWSEMVGLPMAWLGEAEWRAAFEAAGYVPVTTERLIDSRGPGDEADFTPSRHCPDHRTAVELHAAGTLWIRAEKPKPE